MGDEMPAILVADGQAQVRRLVAERLRRDGFGALEAENADNARALLLRERPALAVLDRRLPGGGGLELTRWIRDRSDLPLILVGADTDELERVLGLELGADDFVTKPFSARELTLRVRAVLRRVQAGPVGPLQMGSLQIDPAAYEATRDGVPLPLSTREFELLRVLAEAPRVVFSRDRLMELLWGRGADVTHGALSVVVRRLREKIEREPARPRLVETVRGVGYRFSPERERAPTVEFLIEPSPPRKATVTVAQGPSA
jgi:two-component system, OmpR family, response regulator ResD